MKLNIDRTPVIAVVPHFNRPEQLPDVLDSLKGQGYADAVVLDDASQPDQRYAAMEVATQHDAYFVAGDENRGPGGNRNRILEVGKWADTYLHFIDSDMTVTSTDTAARVRDTLGDDSVGMGGGLINNPDGTPMAWNFGPSFTAKSAVSSLVQMRAAELSKTDPQRAAKMRHRLGFLLNAWPDVTNPQPRDTFWVAEGNMFVPEKTFREIGGFPPIRMHDIVGPATEIARRNQRCVFEPGIAATHNSDGALSNQQKHMLSAAGYLIRRYGLRRFLFGGDNAK